MKLDNILAKIIAIMRGIHLTPIPHPARVDVFTPAGFRQVQWWLQRDAIVETRELAGMVQNLDSEYASASIAAIQVEIDRVLKANFLDRSLFDLRKLKVGKSRLFDAVLGDLKDFARRLWERILTAVKALQPLWLILYPLRGIISNTFDVGFDGLSLMAPSDTHKWLSYSSRYPRTIAFRPTEGSPEQFSIPSIWGINSPTSDRDRPFTWLICETGGTESGITSIAAGRMRTLLALLFAHWHPRNSDFFVFKSDLGEHRCSLKFASVGNRNQDALACGPIGRLMPSLPIDFGISANNIDQVMRWYSAYSMKDAEVQRRATIASHYIHHAVMAEGFERFIHYYISLDAMFGERYKVEESIKKALMKMFPNDPTWEYKADRLFDLRNALIHGGTSTIEGWSGLRAYMQHVRTSPLQDVSCAAMTGLRTYFEMN